MTRANIPTLHIVGQSIPQAYFRAIKAVWGNGLPIRTEYDRKNEAGEFIDPPSRDATVMIEVTDPMSQPRFAPLSFCEIGAYIAEILGAKNHHIVPMDILKLARRGTPLPDTKWPYTYNQRITDHPDINGFTTNQLELAIERLAETPFTRRAVVTTSIPNIDPYLQEDVPCLRELMFRCTEDNGTLFLNTYASWRSRDLYKAWGDNMIGITFWLQTIAKRLAEKTGKPVQVGRYAETSASLHIYGQDFGHVGGSEENDLKSIFETFDEDGFIARSLSSDMAGPMLVIPQLMELLSEKQREQWKFPKESIELIEVIIFRIQSGELIA